MSEFKKIKIDLPNVVFLFAFYQLVWITYPNSVLAPSKPIKIYNPDNINHIATSINDIKIESFFTQNQLPKTYQNVG